MITVHAIMLSHSVKLFLCAILEAYFTCYIGPYLASIPMCILQQDSLLFDRYYGSTRYKCQLMRYYTYSP